MALDPRPSQAVNDPPNNPQNTPPQDTDILGSITDAFVTFDHDWRFTYLNDRAAQVLSRTRTQLLGKSVWEEFPETVGTVSEREYRRAVAERVTVSFECFFPLLNAWFGVSAYPSSQGLSVFFQDITEQVERRRRERLLAGLAERARKLTDPDEVIADAVRSVGEFLGVSRCVFVDIDIETATCTVPFEYRADDSVASIGSVFSISAFGPVVVAEYAAGRAVAVDDVHADPDQVPDENVAAYDFVGIRAHASVPVVHSTRLVSCIGAHSATPRHWTTEEVALLQTVVERTWLTVEVIRQQHALVREAEGRAEVNERLGRILERITDAFMAFDHDWRFTYVNDQAERVMARTREEVLGRSLWDEFPDAVGSTFEREFRRAVDERITVTFEEFYPPLDIWVEVRAYPSPDGLSVFYQDVTTRRRAEEERERLLAEQRTRAERESLLNRIGREMRGSRNPEAVQAAAVALLGEALGADRCYFAVYDLGGGVVTVAQDWQGAGLPSLKGVYPFTNTAAMYRELYRDSTTSVIEDAQAAPLSAQTRANMESLGLRARISAALVDGGGVMATLTAAMADQPRRWTGDEVALVEAVATQLRTAVEMARIAQREHNIATHLQEALQPALPRQVPGLELADYYRPALEEAGVGGDFSDVFASDKGMTFLVVGDLSGKGLAAASQVATVRNMLRFSLYNGRSVAGPVTALNHTLAAHDLLTGFATLFVGCYDAEACTLTYVNCGQDAGLILRAATGQVEALPPTGPILGGFDGASFTEERVMLGAGDALVLYTDGLTEAGPNRTTLLTGDGVAALLQTQTGRQSAPQIVARLMAGVDAHAGGGIRDDQCLLVGVVSRAHDEF